MSDGKMPDINSLMQMAQKLQGDVAKIQEDIARMTVEASSGGGMVSAVVNGQHEVVSIQVDASVVDPADVEMLQDLIVAAVNQAMAKMRDKAKEEMAKITGGLDIPGMPSLF
jgi:nucleoid-associated protein EbfC